MNLTRYSGSAASAALTLCAALVAGCGGSSESTPEPVNLIPGTDIELVADDGENHGIANAIVGTGVATLELGMSGFVRAEATFPDGYTIDVTEQTYFQVETPDVVAISARTPQGVPVATVGAGTGEITMLLGDLNGTIAVEVTFTQARALGLGDGSPESVVFETIHEATQADTSVDIEFSNVRTNELWVLHRDNPSTLPCTQADRRGCDALEGSTTTIFSPGTPAQTETWIKDFNAWHFMRRPPALAFGVNQLFATCGEERTGNFLDDMRADFIGPSLWTSDPAIYRNWGGDRPDDWNGTHMDMLHATPFCTGIAHERDNVYWVVNGMLGSLDRYDFQSDHGPGQADHSDGIIYRYAVGALTRVPDVPAHIAFHNGEIFAADAGGGRIIAYNPEGAQRIAALNAIYEPLEDEGTFSGGTLRELVAPGVLQQPSGLEIYEDIIYVSDAQTSQLHAFDLDGTLLRSLDTGLPAGSLAGLAFSPEGQLYFVDRPNARVIRIVVP